MYLVLLFAIQIDWTIWEKSREADYVNQSGVIHSDERDIDSSVQDALEHSCENPEELEHKKNLHPHRYSAQEADIYCIRYSRDVFYPLMCRD